MADGGGSYANAAVNAAAFAASIYFGNKNLEIAEDQYQLQKSSYELDRQNTYLDTLNTIYGFDKDIEVLKGDKAQIDIDIRDTQTQIGSYEKWLSNYQAMYDAETGSAQAQIAELNYSTEKAYNGLMDSIAENEYSGKQTYQSLVESLGYVDAVTGATGRVGANTSMAQVGLRAKENITDFVGSDMTLDETGGIYGQRISSINRDIVGLVGDDKSFDETGGLYALQKSAADKNYGQLLVDLDFQKQEKESQKIILSESLSTLTTSRDTISQSISESEKKKVNYKHGLMKILETSKEVMNRVQR
jgi:hypothetical protein